MATYNKERVEHALNELLVRILPEDPNDEDEVANERFDEAFEYAIEELETAGDPSVVPDINHVASLIDKRVSRDVNGAQKSARFHNLLSRLISQPVLNQKWRMLHFLNQLSELPQAEHAETRDAARMPITPTKHAHTNPLPTGSPAFKDAFSRPGLSHIPVNDGSPKPSPRPAPAEPADKRRDRRATDASKEQSAEAAPPEPTYLLLGPSEPALLRDLPFTLQGISSTNLIFPSSTALKLPPTLPVPLISLLHTLAEPSLLYRGLSDFVESTEGGLVGQSFRSALGMELRSYLGLVATLEGQIKRALQQLDESQTHHGLGKAGVTLKRCVIWTREATMGLRLMSLMVEESKTKKGGELISLIHSFSLSHGDPYVGAFAERLLAHVTRPFYDMLRQWIYDGELADPFGEFFVSEQSEAEIFEANNGKEGKGGATSVWEDKYKLSTNMIPTIITEDFARKVFLIGKSLNFIRYGCGDAAWVDTYSRSASKELRYGDTANLEQSIGDAYKTTMARLIDLMEKKFHLFEHLQALKSYLLLGSGDFIAVLMESLSSTLDRPANTQYRHTLTAQLEHAVRNSNAQFDSPDVLRRLDSRMLELSHGEIGWDVFTLEYKIDAPVDVIVTTFGSKQYLKVFNFLWRVKRVEFALSSTWRRCMTGARGVLGTVSDVFGSDWKKARCAISEMIHFVNQLQYYILFEVIESSWNELQSSLRKPESTLDDLITAHARYLTNITRKGLLGSSGADFTGQLHELLKTMLGFREAVDGLYGCSVAEFTRRQEVAAKIETRTAAGRWGVEEKDAESASPDPFSSTGKAKGKHRSTPSATSSPFPPALMPLNLPNNPLSSSNQLDILPALRKRLASLLTDFRARVNVLLGDLAHQPDVDMRWLAMVMNFNDVYQPVRRRRKAAPGTKGKDAGREREKETPAPQTAPGTAAAAKG
ncbi:Spc98 family-domain-containing protein [Clohesyomyces aquaticus]|uniref:Spc98 family-domain-containing protein n=1 Tax=Clohesyomyces aquaticus TaxID=1231657 RepID=A0A1Y1YYG2_9PLEO|nr:Spc98 family-domain-containing protein [Clohesyomyces aquaticus]